MMNLGLGLGIADPGQLMCSGVLGGPDAINGGGSSLWTPLNDPNLVAWYQADSYRQDTVSGYPRIVPQDKLNNTANRELVHITAPTGANDLLQLDDTTYDFPVFVTHGKGVKTTDSFQFADVDIYLVARIISAGGNTSRYLDHDYGNGFWLGTGATSGIRLGGFRQGSSPYGYGEAPPDPGSNGWFLMQLSRWSTLADDYQVQFCSDDQNYKTAGVGSSGISNSNPIAAGSDIGGNSGVPEMHIAAILVYRRFKGSHPDTGRPLDRELRRQAWLAHTFPSIKDNIISTLDHPYYVAPPTVDATLTLPGTPKHDWDIEGNVYSDDGTTPITNGVGIYRINDSAGAAHARQTTAGSRPGYRGASVLHYGLNGRPVAQFDGSDDYLEASINLTASTSLLIAWAMAGGTITNKGLFQITDTKGAGTNAVYVRVSDLTAAADSVDIYVNGDYRFTAVVAKMLVMTTFVLHWDGTDWTLYRDGIEIGTYTGGFSNASVATKLFLGCGFSGHGDSNSLFGRFLIYDNIAGVPDPQAVADYLAQRWG